MTEYRCKFCHKLLFKYDDKNVKTLTNCIDGKVWVKTEIYESNDKRIKEGLNMEFKCNKCKRTQHQMFFVLNK